MTGIDIIHQEIEECEAVLAEESSQFTPEKSISLRNHLQAMITNLNSCITNIRGTNNFMLMTINRCLDYTKASNGLKLVPKYETIHLKETLELPLNCMQNIQSKMNISVAPFPLSICSHLITDKQWLQENILCLLSNAVKYSAGGDVNICVSLTQKSKLQRMPSEMDEQVIIASKRNSVEVNRPPVHSVSSNRKSMSKSDHLSASITENNLLLHATQLLQKPQTNKKFQSPSHPHHQKHFSKVHPLDCFTPSSPSLESLNEVGLHHIPTATTLQLTTSFEDSNNHTEPNSPTDGEFLLIEVIDQGIGMSEEAMKTLFNPFKQTQRLAGGTGLGLYSLARRMDAVKGKYGVRSRNDGQQGSIFWFAIPYKPDASYSLKTNSRSLPPTPKSVRNHPVQVDKMEPGLIPQCILEDISQPRKLSVLIAEDTASIAKMTTMILKKQNFLTDIGENGQLVYNKIIAGIDVEQSKLSFDVILMDLQMPVMDGLEATRRIRAYEKQISTGKQPFHHLIIGVSANSDHETVEEAFQAGIDYFLPKPLSVQEFLKIIQENDI
jgi:signal transduction histidine kinase